MREVPVPQRFLTFTQQLIYELVSERPRSTKELHALIWAIYPQDAPPYSVIKAHVWHLNKKLKLFGLEVRAPRGGDYRGRFRNSVYSLRRRRPVA